MSTAGGGAFNMSEFLAQQAARDAQLRQEQDARLTRERREKEDAEERRRKERNDLLAIVMPAVSAIGAAIAGAFGGRQDNTAALIAAVKGPDPLVLLTQLQTLQRQNQPDVLTKILPMLIDMAGTKASGGDTGWLDVIKEFAKSAGPAVGGMIEAQMKAAQLAQAPQPPPMQVTSVANPQLTHSPSASSSPADSPPTIVVPESVRRRERRSVIAPVNSPVGSPTPQPASSPGRTARTAANSSPSNGNADMNLLPLLPHLPWLREILGYMLEAARRGKSPQIYAALFLEETPEEITGEMILTLLGAEDWFTNICKLMPQWNDSRLVPWLQSARSDILTTIQNAIAPTPPDPRGIPVAMANGKPIYGEQSISVPMPPAKPQNNSGEIDRPTKLPSLTGD